MGDSYAESEVVFLCGPIEYWWSCFDSPLAVEYRKHRDDLRDFLVDEGYLVYSPHGAFRGPWNERMQGLNDYALDRSNILINMSPPGIPGKGTAHETQRAIDNGIIVLYAAPGCNFDTLLLLLKEKVGVN